MHDVKMDLTTTLPPTLGEAIKFLQSLVDMGINPDSGISTVDRDGYKTHVSLRIEGKFDGA